MVIRPLEGNVRLMEIAIVLKVMKNLNVLAVLLIIMILIMAAKVSFSRNPFYSNARSKLQETCLLTSDVDQMLIRCSSYVYSTVRFSSCRDYFTMHLIAQKTQNI